jgi:ubiquitin carboxyl-terminal hydrolase 1
MGARIGKIATMTPTMEAADYINRGPPAPPPPPPNASLPLDHRLFLSPDFRSAALQTLILGGLLAWLLALRWRLPPFPQWYLLARLKATVYFLRRAVASLPGSVCDAFGFLHGTVARGEQAAVPFGIANPSLGCFQNSVVQALSSLGCLARYVGFSAAGGETSRALADALVALNSSHPRAAGDIRLPPALRKMSVLQEQDAQEYFSVLAEALAGEHAAARERALLASWDAAGAADAPPNPLEGTLAQRVRCARCGHHEGVRHEPFTSITLSTSRPQEELLGGSGARGRIAQGTTLQACLAAFTAPERVDGVECRRCTVLHHRRRLAERLAARRGQGSRRLQRARARRVAQVERAIRRGDFSDAAIRKVGLAARRLARSPKVKQHVVGAAPAALVLHVSRSVFDPRSGAQTKDRRRVVIPPVLDLAPWMAAAAGEGSGGGGGGADMRPRGAPDPRRPSPHTYGLRALVDHKGGHGSGHYVCFRRCAPAPARPPPAAAAGDGGRRLLFPGWYLCDDAAVRTADEAEAVHGTRHGEPFLLYYERLSEEERVLAGAACTPAPESDDDDDDEEGVVVQRVECGAVVEEERRRRA